MSDATTEQPSYEEAREELIEVVRTLEAGGTTLEESLALWRARHPERALRASGRPLRARSQAVRRGARSLPAGDSRVAATVRLTCPPSLGASR